jgi:uncharacterized protein YuzE
VNLNGMPICKIPTATINGKVWIDMDENGSFAGEAFFEGAKIKALLQPANTLVATKITDSAGYFEFLTLSAGTYNIVLEMPAGFTMSAGSNSGSNEVNGVSIPPPISVLGSVGAFGIIPLPTP